MLSKRSLVGIRLNFQTLAVLFFMLVGVSAYAADPAVASSDEAIAAGKTVFNANCKQCHKLDQKNVGPALRGISDRRPIAWANKIPGAIASRNTPKLGKFIERANLRYE
jgi:cytochrome c2